MWRPPVPGFFHPRALCAALVACSAFSAWARPADLPWLEDRGSLLQVLAPADADDLPGTPLGFGDLEWHGLGGEGDDEEGADEAEDDELPVDDEGRVMARAAAMPAAPAARRG